MTRTSASLRVTFVLERHLGHQTFADNLRDHVVGDDTVDATFVDVTYAATTAFWERLPIGDQVRGALRGRRQIRTGLRNRRRHVTFFNTQVPAVLGGRAARRGPYVLCTDITPVQYDGMATAYGHEPDTGGLAATIKHAANRRVFRQAAHIVAWSRWVRSSLIADYQVDPDEVSVIPPGVDVSRWTPRNERRTGPLRILFVGGDLHRKGGGTLLSAFAALPPGTAELTLVTRSRHPQTPGVRVERGLTPNAPALIELYRSSDVFVLPSEAEAFGIAAVEAAAAGLPVIATPVGGLRDIVVDGETGYLISPADADALCHHLRGLAEDEHLRARLGATARARALVHFDADRNARAIIDLLRTVVTGSPPRVPVE